MRLAVMALLATALDKVYQAKNHPRACDLVFGAARGCVRRASYELQPHADTCQGWTQCVRYIGKQ